MIDCIHCRGVEGDRVSCASNRLLPLPPPGGTALRRIAVCLRPCPYLNRPNIPDDEIATILDQQQPVERPPELTPDNFPCVHRGEVLTMRECQLCGRRGQFFRVFRCTVHGECSIGTRERGLQACVACEDQAPV